MTGNGIPASGPDLPEGIDRSDVEDHAVTVQLAGQLINSTSAYLTAPTGSPEEKAAEDYLDMLASRIASSPDAAGRVLLAMASLLVGTADQDEVQKWFTEQSAHIMAVLGE
ncbi:hypothetical protein SEA_NICOLE72_48 [Microbacterium phage Nicole72]|uniref:Uncharacterized protein n=1 Tax=Microbacterium phage Nicole72 TaxID=3062838 RepID=A0ACD4UL20_9CAUD|nr:hypothetical protein SEA_NICOLE72_48 [Microbacterium phage Nicole72]